ncbi:MAG: Fic family protein [Coriobacteriales bacterium]|jgi:Fic family protein|nr:Fic family protein [Coriobacteriales bacterium]
MVAEQKERDASTCPKSRAEFNDVFIPHPIAHIYLNFRLETLALESKAVADLVRFDERMRNYPYRSALLKSLKRAESIATVRTDGIHPEVEQILLFEVAARLGKAKPRGQKEFVRKTAANSDIKNCEASFEAYRCMKALDYIMDVKPGQRKLTRDDIVELQRLCVRGTRREVFANLRKDDGKTEYYPSTSKVAYCPPKADQIIYLLDDLIEFSNREDISPLIRAIIAHFQLEAIQPYSEGLDRLGRMFALLIMRNTGIFENIIPPFSITPAVQTRHHTEYLIPYRTGQSFERHDVMPALDKWVEHSSRATDRSVKYAEIYRRRIKEIVNGWRQRLGDAYGSASLDTLLSELPGSPILSAADATAFIDRSYQTANECVSRLVEIDILRPINSTKRNRLFRSDDMLSMLQEIEAAFMPEKAIPREDFYSPRIYLS